jgi:deoxyribodipyrimidine photo-lyase
MIHNERLKMLNDKPLLKKKYVLYWMQQAQRSEYNHALEYAIETANKLDNPLLVCFGLTHDFPEANARHYHFMLEGLKETKRNLKERGIQMIVQPGPPRMIAENLARHACAVITDRGYLRIQREWRRYVANRVPCSVMQVETDVVVPVETVSAKEEYSAATIRNKIQRRLKDFLIPIKKTRITNRSVNFTFKQLDIDDIGKAIKRLKIDHSVARTSRYTGGTSVAKKLLKDFIRTNLRSFGRERNDPGTDILSLMSPYLHFGQISPLYIALQVRDAQSPGTDSYLEELIVRRELSMNFVFYNQQYDSFGGLPKWAQHTLKAHSRDRRPYVYTASQLEQAQTHDPYWNAAQMEMNKHGKMHGYMRMYWGKKIIEWTENPTQAFEIALYLNNKYELDGRDPNGYAGVAWCFGKHDRPWPERRIFGKVRYMNAAGLKRKFRIEKYVNRILRQE